MNTKQKLCKTILNLCLVLFPLSTVSEENRADDHYFQCSRLNSQSCKNSLQKGDVLIGIPPKEALLYCDMEKFIYEKYMKSVTCVYNGKPIKEIKSLE